MKLRKRMVGWLMFLTGGAGYSALELLYRRYTHWSMFLLGGACFVAIDRIQARLRLRLPLWQIAILCALTITLLEFATGCVVNLLLGWNVWNYSHLPLNIMGQICVLFMVLWYLLSIPATRLARMFRRFYCRMMGVRQG